MYLHKVISRKNSLKKLFFCWHLEGSGSGSTPKEKEKNKKSPKKYKK
jgi:hypothetical protein